MSLHTSAFDSERPFSGTAHELHHSPNWRKAAGMLLGREGHVSDLVFDPAIFLEDTAAAQVTPTDRFVAPGARSPQSRRQGEDSEAYREVRATGGGANLPAKERAPRNASQPSLLRVGDAVSARRSNAHGTLPRRKRTSRTMSAW